MLTVTMKNCGLSDYHNAAPFSVAGDENFLCKYLLYIRQEKCLPSELINLKIMTTGHVVDGVS